MKNYMKIVVVLALAVNIITGCGTQKHNNNNAEGGGPADQMVQDSKMMQAQEKDVKRREDAKPATEAPAPSPKIREEKGDTDRQPHNTESYSTIKENDFFSVKADPLSTFSIDVDKASYANARRFLKDNHLPPAGSVRLEEFINYFPYNYPQPAGDKPFSISTYAAPCPWNKQHQLVQIGLQGKDYTYRQLPANNLVFLIDVSGSMDADNKLPLLQKAYKLLAEQLRPQDRIAIVVYAGSAGLVLPSTSGTNREEITQAIDKLKAGGSTNGGEGLELAYKTAKDNYIANGNNRIILATDGDFNVGTGSRATIAEYMETRRKDNIDITVMGLGMGNYKDDMLETIAQNGNGNYFYIDDIQEANRVLNTNLAGTLMTIAKDVKIQIEFNPAFVKSYRLIGYENRVMNNQDFTDDKKDAGEIGAGHNVTALYEIELEQNPNTNTNNNLKYTENRLKPEAIAQGELVTVKFRYKLPTETVSKELQQTLYKRDLGKVEPRNFNLAASLALFGMVIRDSKYKGEGNYALVTSLAKDALRSKTPSEIEAEYLELINKAQSLPAPKASDK